MGKKKTRKCDEKIEGIINKPDVNYVKKYTNKNFETCWICSVVELRWQSVGEFTWSAQ